MATLIQNSSPSQKRDGIAVYGYVRENSNVGCWVVEIIQIIIQFYMSKGGSLYMCGNGDFGQLGSKEDGNIICRELHVCPPFANSNAMDVSAGVEHTLIVDIDGNVWGCGNASCGRLGIDLGEDTFVFIPHKLHLTYSVLSVAAGYFDSLLLFSNGYVAQIHGSPSYKNVPIIIESLKKYKIIQIAAGLYHLACLTEGGALFCFGDARKGQCGIGEQGDDDNKPYYVETPTKVKLQKKIIFVGCGFYHTLLITSDGFTYSFGSGEDGELGHGSSDNHFLPALIDGLKEKNIINCAGGRSHSICVNSEG